MKRIYTISIYILGFTTIFWFGYTIVYQIIDGWHYKAVRESEMVLDIICAVLWKIGIFGWVISAATLVDKIMRNVK